MIMYGHMFRGFPGQSNHREKPGIDRHKKTPAFQGSGVTAHSPHLAESSAGIGTLPALRRWVAGLRRAVSLHLSWWEWYHS